MQASTSVQAAWSRDLKVSQTQANVGLGHFLEPKFIGRAGHADQAASVRWDEMLRVIHVEMYPSAAK